jgi:hypothetical protein
MDDQNENLEAFIHAFNNDGEYDIEFDNALILDRSVIPSARPSQASYNKPNNWRDRNRIGLEKVKKQLQSCIDSVMHDRTFDLVLSHNIYGHQMMDNEEPIVWHEPILDEYWNRLEANIDRVRQLEIVTTMKGTHMLIMNVEMRKERLDALVDIFRSGRAAINSCKNVTFTNTNLCGEGIISLSRLVDVSSKLQAFSIRRNRIDNMDSARCLSRSLKSHTRINDLRLTHCDLGSSPEILLLILQSDVKHIDLENNNIDSLGAVKIAEYLEGNPPIRHIDLTHNRLNDDDVILISQALKRNTNLFTINLHSNNITSIGVKALLNCVFDSSSLNAISESNHTLENINIFSELGRLSLFTRQKNGSLNVYIDNLLELGRIGKIVLALQDKDSLLKYLANAPVELIPEVLGFPQRIVNQPQHKHLNIVYSTMRWWNMPMLYSYHHCV